MNPTAPKAQMDIRSLLLIWVEKEKTWKSGKYPDLHPEEIAGRAKFLKAVHPPFHPWPCSPHYALCTWDAIEAIAKISNSFY